MKRKHDGNSSTKTKKAVTPKAPVVHGTKTFGEKFKEDWLTRNYNINYDTNILWTNTCERRKEKSRLETILQKSREFPIPFPVVNMRCIALKNKVPAEQLEANINSTYPLVHEKTLELYVKFIKFKSEFGSSIEKVLYKDMNVVQLVQRLMDLRAVSFWGRGDKYLLMSKHKGMSKWDTIGTDDEKPPLTLNKVISYDEVKLSALLYVSGYTQFINNGLRQNAGIPADNKNDIEESGIIIGLIGTRLCKKQVMEYEEIIVTKEQNNPKNGYGPLDETASSEQIKKQKWRQLWADFYEEPNNLYTDVLEKMKKDGNHFSPARAKNAYFDNSYYKKRLCLTIDTLLFEVNERARKAKKLAYIHMVGIGLGVWRNANHQGSVVLDVFAQRLRYLKNHTHHISDVHFAYFRCDEGTDEIKNNDLFEDKNHHNGGVRIHISNREPSAKLTGEHSGKLLIQTYPWDGNAQPGNEFWFGKLKTSGDPAAACSSQVAELHNSHINRSNVCGSNLRVVSRKHGLLHIADYVKTVQRKK